MIKLNDFERIVFFTGAGLSAESGIPTYRGKGGIWHKYNYEDYACQRAFDRDPNKVWDFHDKRREMMGSTDPNDGHRIIAEVQKAKPGTWVVTQNVDGLHQRAGAVDVIELHGSMWRVRCDTCQVIRDNDEVPLSNRQCGCGTYWRPDIVWFEDSLDARTIQAAQKAIGQCDLLVSVGTSGVVFPAAHLPQIAVQAGATCVEVNPEETPVSGWYQHHLRGPASEMLRGMWEG
jgi:NAD-dependent deacetylase